MTAPTPAMPEEPYYGMAAYFDPDCRVVDKINYDALRLYATHLREENERLRKLLVEAACDIDGWGMYASDYFKNKHDLAGCVKRYIDTAKGEKENC